MNKKIIPLGYLLINQIISCKNDSVNIKNSSLKCYYNYVVACVFKPAAALTSQLYVGVKHPLAQAHKNKKLQI